MELADLYMKNILQKERYNIKNKNELHGPERPF